MKEEELEAVSRTKILTLNVYLLCMLLIDYLDELMHLPPWAMSIKNFGQKFKKALEHKIVENQINHIYSQDKGDYAYMIKHFERLTKLISTYDPEEIEDFMDIADEYKNNKEEFMKHFNILRDEK